MTPSPSEPDARLDEYRRASRRHAIAVQVADDANRALGAAVRELANATAALMIAHAALEEPPRDDLP